MKVIIFGASGMLGQGVLHVCLRDKRVTDVLVVGRSSVGMTHPKLTEMLQPDLYDVSPIAHRFAGYDATFFCLGTSSAGMKEADYTRVTYDLTMSIARSLAEVDPGSTFIYVSGAGTDSSEQGRSMWARVKGRTENALLALSLDSYMFRPGIIQPLRGITSKTRLYRIGYTVATPLFPILRKVAPTRVITTDEIAWAMLAVAENGHETRIMESPEIAAAGRARPTREM